jgi:hypothetical protein
MIQLNFTKNIIDYFKIQDDCIFIHKENNDLIGNWYLNIFRIERKPIFVLVNEKTFLSFIIHTGINKNNLQSLFDAFRNELEIYLKHEKFDDNIIKSILKQYLDIQITKTYDRSILGTMNNLIDIYKIMIYDEGGLKYCDLINIFLRINRIPQRRLNWLFSIEQTRKLLEN